MEIKQGKPLTLLPPPPDHCQICGVKHDESLPHNPQSFYYKYWFAANNYRTPTWADALAHCSKEVQDLWTKNLSLAGIDINSSNLTGSIKSEEDLTNILAKVKKTRT